MAIQEVESPSPMASDPLAMEAELVERARRLGPTFRARAEATEKNRTLLKETMAALFDAQLLRYFQPKRYGGFELEWGAQFSIGREIAKFCPATAWIASVVGSHASFVGRMKPELQDEVWGKTPDMLICTASVARKGVKAVREKGGFRVKGQWGFASGIDHAGWGVVPVEVEGETDRYQMAVPAGEFGIVDTWFVSGMRGTGTKDILLDDVFIPEHRTLAASVWLGANPPGARVGKSYVYSCDFHPFVGTSLLGPLYGTAEGAFNAYVEQTRGRSSVMGGARIDEMAPVQLRLAESGGELKAALMLIEEHIRVLRRAGNAGVPVPGAQRLEINRDRAFAARLCLNATERLVQQLGALSLQDSNPVQRHYRDVAAMSTQIGINWDRNLLPYAKLLLGLPTGDHHVDAELKKAAP
jgi:3-hydroxy-9,10-secoandrosta-1,3,5(10)-triene-9,17-dione monooxygenase